MTDRPKIPYESVPKTAGAAFMVDENRIAKRWVRKLSEAGKLSGRPAKKIPHLGRTDEPPEVVT